MLRISIAVNDLKGIFKDFFFHFSISKDEETAGTLDFECKLCISVPSL